MQVVRTSKSHATQNGAAKADSAQARLERPAGPKSTPHLQLVAAGDIPDAGSKEEKIAVMRDLFDRSKGRIKQLIIEKERRRQGAPQPERCVGKRMAAMERKRLFRVSVIYASD